ncbi:MAG TPA: PIN domain-containing protein [bacterium]|mgnify:CR=1 FL=1|nr:PIN domain-containing protein [bacterium]
MGANIIRVIFLILSILLSYCFFPSRKVIGIIIGLLGGGLIIFIEILLERISFKKLLLAVGGLIVGLITAILLTRFFLLIPIENPQTENYLRFILYFIFSYLGIMLGIKGVEELGFVFPFLHSVKGDEKVAVVDTSILIDGRVYELAKSGFIDYTLVIPQFVLKELHELSDCSSDMKRQRGRRGLETINKMRKDASLDVKIYDTDYPDIPSVDAKLVKLAADLRAAVLTNDFNLSKLASVQNIKILNFNTLADILKPRLASGERISLKIIKEGKEADQGIGYLEDGTMIVVEKASKYVGKVADIIIDSAIQTSSGRIIFAKLKT